jgi:hypothetical protein
MGSTTGILPFLLSLTLLFSEASRPAPRSPNPADELVGLWKAQRWFGPHARGPLILHQSPTGWTADFVGRTIPVGLDRTNLSFDMPSGQGAFRGRLGDGNVIRGHWYPPNSVGLMGGIFKYASPVELRPDTPKRWKGRIVPFEDVFTFYLMVQKRPDGTAGAYLRNPERNFGMVLGVDRLVREGNAVKLIGKRLGRQRTTRWQPGPMIRKGR